VYEEKMAQLFVVGNYEWLVAALEDEAYSLHGDNETTLRPGLRAEAAGGESDDASSPVILRVPCSSGGECWAVIHTAGSSVRVNGTALSTGIRALSHRDELRVGGAAGRVFFSSERLACVVPFDGVDTPHCPRCQTVIERGTPAVKCPQCAVWFHQSDEFPCWTYSPTCALCDQPTELEGGFRWTPEEVVPCG
jgi:hypothetical protein